MIWYIEKKNCESWSTPEGIGGLDKTWLGGDIISPIRLKCFLRIDIFGSNGKKRSSKEPQAT